MKENPQFKFNILPFDETEDPSIPRMLAQYNRDKLEISQQRVSYQSIFKLDLLNNSDLFKMAKRRERVVSLIVSKLEYLYSGFILKYLVKFDSDEEVWKYLKAQLGSKPLEKKLVNFSYLYSFSRSDQNFININIAAIMKSELSAHSGIEISIDVNDKLKAKNTSEIEQGLAENINIVEDILENYSLENLVRGDIYE
ncbi:MAG: hypothetical protein EDM75_11835 [Chlorobiota bacterium]|nr:MAG: hypothetical protein EDM75_11835 [Chlorobiota bacterium]